jgi:hypothetical protein
MELTHSNESDSRSILEHKILLKNTEINRKCIQILIEKCILVILGAQASNMSHKVTGSSEETSLKIMHVLV